MASQPSDSPKPDNFSASQMLTPSEIQSLRREKQEMMAEAKRAREKLKAERAKADPPAAATPK